MTLILLILALVPAVYAALVTGDFTQFFYKPGRKQIHFVLVYRWVFAGLSILLWLAAFFRRFYGDSLHSGFYIISALLIALGFLISYMPSLILFKGLRQPEWLSASDAFNHFSADEPVIGLAIEGDARAYPVASIQRPHLVHDLVGGEKITVSYCMLCNSAMAFKSEFEGQTLDLITPLQWENNLMMYDRAGKRLIQQLTGRIIAGTDEGQVLESYPVQIMPLAAWLKIYPQTKLMHFPAQGRVDHFIRTMLRTKIDVPNRTQEAPIFPTITRFDERLPNKTEVLGVCVEDACKAYPMHQLQESPVINDVLLKKPLLISYDAHADEANIFVRQHGGITLSFHEKKDAQDSMLLTDAETNSTWNSQGLAISGELKGTQLEPYDHLNRVLWYSWINFFPHTDLALN